MSRWLGTTFQKQREQHNANRAYHLATQRKDHEHARDSQGRHIPTYSLLPPLEQSLARTTDSGRVIGDSEVGITRAIFQRGTWDRGPQLPCCVIRRMCAIAHSTRERMSISETRVRWTGHFSAISSSFERCSWVSRPANSRSLSMWSSIPSLVSQSAQSAACILLWRSLTVTTSSGQLLRRAYSATVIEVQAPKAASSK